MVKHCIALPQPKRTRRDRQKPLFLQYQIVLRAIDRCGGGVVARVDSKIPFHPYASSCRAVVPSTPLIKAASSWEA